MHRSSRGQRAWPGSALDETRYSFLDQEVPSSADENSPRRSHHGTQHVRK